jgi:hypothetical protein
MKIMNKNVFISCLIISYTLLSGITAYGIPGFGVDSNGEPISFLDTFERGPRVWGTIWEMTEASNGILFKYDITDINDLMWDFFNESKRFLDKYDVNDVNDLIKATTDRRLLIRAGAYHILTLKESTKAIPILRNGLNDRFLLNQVAIARFLAFLGNQSGLERMKEDITSIIEYEDLLNDPNNTISDLNKKEKPPLGLNAKLPRLRHCMSAAVVLAEFGDSFGYELAKKQLNNESIDIRLQAVEVLAHLTKIDKNVQQAKGINPESVLLEDLDIKNFNPLARYVLSIVGATMNYQSQIRIFEKLIQSPDLSNIYRRQTENRIKQIQTQLEKEKQAERTDK